MNNCSQKVGGPYKLLEICKKKIAVNPKQKQKTQK